MAVGARESLDYRRLAERLRHVASPIRLGVLMSLEGGDQTSVALCSILGCGRSLLSRHTTYLRYAGFIVARRDGLQISYSATPAGRAMQRVVRKLVD
jgi:hypothetical protein